MTGVCVCVLVCVLVCACSKKLISKLLTPHKAAPASTCHLSATSPPPHEAAAPRRCHMLQGRAGSGRARQSAAAALRILLKVFSLQIAVKCTWPMPLKRWARSCSIEEDGAWHQLVQLKKFAMCVN